MDTFKRLLKEFWLPFLIATAWTFYNLATSGSAGDIKAIINIFGPSFFLVSWATGQFFRVRKQTHVEKNLRSIEGRLENVVNRIEAGTSELLSHMIGGDSFCYLQFLTADSTSTEVPLVVVHHGEHPLYDVHVRIVDIECMEELSNSGVPMSLSSLESCDMRIEIGNLIPGHAGLLQPFPIRAQKSLRLNVFFTARNGDFTQLIRMEEVAGRWFSATRVKKEDRLLYEKIEEGFPGDLNADVGWRNVVR